MTHEAPAPNDLSRTASELAADHRVTDGPPREISVYRALPELSDWLERVRSYCQDPAAAHMRAADWLLDNDYQVARTLRRLERDLPPTFYRKLPALGASDDHAPRVYVLARAILDTLTPQISLNGLVQFIRAYQESTALTNAELWALPSMLRLAALAYLLDAFGRLEPDLMPSFAAPASQVLDPTEQVALAIMNLTAIEKIKWADFVDTVSCIEAVLCEDPAQVYARMTFDTRDRYRGKIEQLALRARMPETDVARHAVGLAQAHVRDAVQAHVGYWLIDAGLAELEAAITYRPTLGERLLRHVTRRAGLLYAASLIAGLCVSLALPWAYLTAVEATTWQRIGGLAISVLPASIISVTLVHWLITKITRPAGLPEMDFSKGIPEACATAVVIPVIVASEDEVAQIAEKLEIRRLTNPDPTLRYVLLSDLVDADQEILPEDDRIEQALITAIERLNRQYGATTNGPFFLLHRHRKFNAAEDCWMGWERKRGKLDQFNRLVLGKAADRFAVTVGDLSRLAGVRYAIVLDADTDLPPAAAGRMVGLMAHPLNHAQVDPESGWITSGYAILQPRIEILSALGDDTRFTYLYGGDTAIDIYSRAVSDVYQDLFGTGIFVGKGIYDIAAVHNSLAGRVPENRILSHDLFEGVHGRSALASNVILYEDLPASYPAYAMRAHRWVRGDWQLIPWLWLSVPMAAGTRARNLLGGLDRWKIVDNLRRSLLPPALLVFFIGGWTMLPGNPLLWTLLALAAPGSYLVGALFSLVAGGVREGWFGTSAHLLKAQGGRWFLSIAFLVNDSMTSLDAIARTLWRLGVSKKRLLEWTSAAHASASLAHRSMRSTAWRLMWPASAVAIGLFSYLIFYDRAAFLAALPVLALWVAAPEIAVWTARPRLFRGEELDAEQRAFLARVARRTWHFFETFVGPEDNWLPPDNFQEDTTGKLAHRTSPTNIGLFLVSAVAARDFGFITTSDFLARSRNTVNAVGRLQSYRGHILNWYDTRTLDPLEPQYVSTVDNGNLAVSLIALKQACGSMAGGPAIHVRCFDGLLTTFDLMIDAVGSLPACDTAALDTTATLIRKRMGEARTTPARWLDALDQLATDLWEKLEKITRDAIAQSEDVAESTLNEVHVWRDRYHHHLHAIRRDTQMYLPWLSLIAGAPEGETQLAQSLVGDLSPLCPLNETSQKGADQLAKIAARMEARELPDEARIWLEAIQEAVTNGIAQQKELQSDLHDLAQLADTMAYGMDFSFLYDPDKRLFAIGYNLSAGQMDANHYDLLATEARLASYFAVAKHDAPVEHWFSFGRPITRLEGKPSILSWNGSMFEYLMPPLFLPSHRDTLLGESERSAVVFQQHYAAERGVPWGISESAFGVTDADGNYQYRAFGVPGLGIRRGLTEDLVVAPYGTGLALCAWPQSAAENLACLEKLGALTIYGFIEALDFTPGRASEAQDFVPVRTYMAHHQGMMLAAIANALDDDVLVRLVMREKSLQAVKLLLQEQVPWDVPIEIGRAEEGWDQHVDARTAPPLAPWVPSADAMVPQMHVLGNGRMSAAMTDSGGGGLMWQDQALTRWRADPTQETFGTWLYLRDRKTGEIWSAGRGPTGQKISDSRAVFHQHMVELLRRHNGITTRLDVTIAPFDDVELRRMTIVNESNQDRTLDLTTYAEVVLAPPLDDERHPAFSKLFVGSSYLEQENALLFERRARRPEDHPPVLLHKLVTDDPEIAVTGFETDRAVFIGRNGSVRAPQGLKQGLEGTTGWTLDPVMALQIQLHLKPLEQKQVSFLTIAGTSRAQVLEVARRYPAPSLERVFRDASLEAARQVQRLTLDPAQLPELQVLSSLLRHPSHTLRSAPPDGAQGWQGQNDLWRFGLSGDLPILLVQTDAAADSELLDTLIRAQRLWHRSGLLSDLVVLRGAGSSYEEPLRERILSILRDSHSEGFLGRSGGIHLLSSDQMTPVLRQGVQAAAHVVLRENGTSLAEQLDAILETRVPPPRFEQMAPPAYRRPSKPRAQPMLAFANGYGGFDTENGDYVIRLAPGAHTPAPWCNVIANDTFGTVVNEAGLGFTWAMNSGEHRVTPWSNDPVANTPGEVLYLRDEATGEVWTPTPAPMGHDAECEIRHGQGTTRWTQESRGLEQELLAVVPTDAPVKLVRLRITNRSGQKRRITATYYAEWLLGAMGSVAKPHISCTYDPAQKAILAQNTWNPAFGRRTAFLTASLEPHSITGDRHDFLGRDGHIGAPDALGRWDLGGRFTAGGDACAAYQVHLDIGTGASTEVVFVLGEAEDQASATALIHTWRHPARVDQALAGQASFWDSGTGTVQITTPDAAMDLMVNRWLPYQNLACRIMARAGFYQAGGAFGFRDQLQDMLAVLASDPARARDHILYAARHQFDEGDVLHWWHPPEGRGVRTRFSDDYLWLPFVAARYVEATGDRTILDEEIPFLSAPELRAEETDRYAHFDTGAVATLFEHCARAIDRMMHTGAHGLPLMGTGDWNDGMDRIGSAGRGESVWLAWFQIAVVRGFAPIAAGLGQTERAERWRHHVANLRNALKDHAWDGAWYLRAFDDDGLPWGAQANDECQIDLIAQAWSVLSGEPVDERAQAALEAAYAQLVDIDARLIRLLKPPFHHSGRDPGYIRAYPPGIRENGGQYTHAATWLGLAFAQIGDGDRAWQMFDIINPVRRTLDRPSANHYRREPYVLTGDVSGAGERTGQGGWSWYTGAAGWAWQLAVTGILGVQFKGEGFTCNPCLPTGWGGAAMIIDHPKGKIALRIEDPENIGKGVTGITIDGTPLQGSLIPFPGPQKDSTVVVTLGTGPS